MFGYTKKSTKLVLGLLKAYYTHIGGYEQYVDLKVITIVIKERNDIGTMRAILVLHTFLN